MSARRTPTGSKTAFLIPKKRFPSGLRRKQLQSFWQTETSEARRRPEIRANAWSPVRSWLMFRFLGEGRTNGSAPPGCESRR